MTRRSKLDICMEVLMIIKDGTRKPTRIMYGANINWIHLHRVLKMMVSQELIKEIDTRNLQRYDKRSNRTYEITQKGADVIRYFNRAKDIFKLEEVAAIR